MNKFFRMFSNNVLWYKTKEYSWLSAQEYYLKLTENCKITVLKVEYYD